MEQNHCREKNCLIYFKSILFRKESKDIIMIRVENIVLKNWELENQVKIIIFCWI